MTLRSGRLRLVGGSARTVVTVIALLAAMTTPAFASSGAAAANRPAAARACHKATGPFTVHGTKVTGARGRVFVPYGITVPGLANKDYQDLVPLDDAKISATAAFWCANTVRLQIGQDNLVGLKGTKLSKAFLQAIEGEVRVAEKAGLVVVLNDQTEDESNEIAPTRPTVAFWRDLSRVYGRDRQVIFDLFNQPRLFMEAACGNNDDWTFWHRGGIFRGKAYLGMQTLVNDVRADGAKNLLWAEGPCFANSLNGLAGHLLKGGNIVYAFQHPKGPHTAAQWYSDFGWMLFRHVAPIVDAEWTNFAAAKSECWPDAPKAIPAYLRYLQRRGIGMTAFQLKKGVLIKTRNLTDPTRIFTSGKAKWRCAGNLDEGAGSELLAWFRNRNS
ncbi:MAG TPA: cellulase family glycosylhydrolase [Streptosporangiaceae bacterium]|nr:cellulase family glycosylhydrolase [Streptosporangiaceae bacterium]